MRNLRDAARSLSDRIHDFSIGANAHRDWLTETAQTFQGAPHRFTNKMDLTDDVEAVLGSLGNVPSAGGEGARGAHRHVP